MKQLSILVLMVLLLTNYVIVFSQEKTEEKKEEKKESWADKGQLYGTVFANFHTDMETSAFEVSRAYLGYKMKIDEHFSGNVKLDIGEPGATNYDTITLSNQARFAYFKNAYLQYSINNLDVQFGLADYQQFKVQEKFWGYRYIYKSFQDQYKFGSSAELGLFANYKFNDLLSMDASVVNGEGYKEIQSDDNYIAALGATLTPAKAITLRAYFGQSTAANDAQSTVSTFVGYKHEKFSVGGEFDYQLNHKSTADKDLYGFSAFTTVNLTEKFKIFGRFDKLLSNTLTGATDPWNYGKNGQLIIGGVEFSPIKKVNLALNYQGWMPEDSGKDTKNYVYLNLQYSF